MNATAPAAAVTVPAASERVDNGETILVILAREIAMDIQPLENILANHEIDSRRWEEIRANPHFIRLLRSQVEEWNGALNTAERVKIKALSCIEEAMPEFFGAMIDKTENLPARVKALEAFGNLAGLGKNSTAQASGEKFSVTINLGADQQIKVTAPTLAPASALIDQ